MLSPEQMSRQGATATATFGYVRMESLGALVNATFLMALCFTIVIEAMHRFMEPVTEALIHGSHDLIVVGMSVYVCVDQPVDVAFGDLLVVVTNPPFSLCVSFCPQLLSDFLSIFWDFSFRDTTLSFW